MFLEQLKGQGLICKGHYNKCFYTLTASNEIPVDCFILLLPLSVKNISNCIYIVSSIVLTYYQYMKDYQIYIVCLFAMHAALRC
jgi:hypothetical protein